MCDDEDHTQHLLNHCAFHSGEYIFGCLLLFLNYKIYDQAESYSVVMNETKIEMKTNVT